MGATIRTLEATLRKRMVGEPIRTLPQWREGWRYDEEPAARGRGAGDQCAKRWLRRSGYPAGTFLKALPQTDGRSTAVYTSRSTLGFQGPRMCGPCQGTRSARTILRRKCRCRIATQANEARRRDGLGSPTQRRVLAAAGRSAYRLRAALGGVVHDW